MDTPAYLVPDYTHQNEVSVYAIDSGAIRLSLFVHRMSRGEDTVRELECSLSPSNARRLAGYLTGMADAVEAR